MRISHQCLLISASLIAVATPALAQSASINVPAQAMASAVQSLSRQTGAQIVIAGSAGAGKRSHAVSGNMNVGQALARMLAGTGLVARNVSPGTWAIVAEGTPADTTSAPADTPQEIVVTAQKRAEPLSKVPISETVFSAKDLQARGAKDFKQIAADIPGLTLQAQSGSGFGDYGDSNVAIRGVISGTGAPTTAIYIDDVPVHVRQFADWSNGYPKLFDLDRVEVLRGPQGTLFAGSAEGGAILFVTPTPSLTTASGAARVAVEASELGAPSYEAGAAWGGPISDGTLGFRASGWVRRDGGFADRFSPATGARLAQNTNWEASIAGRLALRWQPAPSVSITPSLFYQNLYEHDKGLFWEQFGLYGLRSAIIQPRHDIMALPSLAIEAEIGGVRVKSITSYLHRNVDSTYDATTYELTSLAGVLQLPNDPTHLVTQNTVSSDRAWTQELRLTSVNPDARLSWVAGFFYQHSDQAYNAAYSDPNLDSVADFVDGDNLGCASPAAANLTWCAEAPLHGLYSYTDIQHQKDTEIAGYANLTYRLTARLKASAGVRVSHTIFTFTDAADGPWGPGTPTASAGRESAHPVTPRFNLTWQVDPDHMLYTSVAKGFRVGAVNSPVFGCEADLAQLGLTSAPVAVAPDSLRSYEAGFKGSFLSRRLRLEASVFRIDWKDIQQVVYLPSCGYTLNLNLGRARSQGGDLQARLTLLHGVTLNGSLAYTDARNTSTIQPASGVLITHAGDPLPTPRWSFTLGAEYRGGETPAGKPYVRIDESWQERYRRFGRPGEFSYDPVGYIAPAVNNLNVKLGFQFGRHDVSVYVDNVLDSATSLYRTRDTLTTDGIRDIRPRPRSFGLALDSQL